MTIESDAAEYGLRGNGEPLTPHRVRRIILKFAAQAARHPSSVPGDGWMFSFLELKARFIQRILYGQESSYDYSNQEWWSPQGVGASLALRRDRPRLDDAVRYELMQLRRAAENGRA